MCVFPVSLSRHVFLRNNKISSAGVECNFAFSILLQHKKNSILVELCIYKNVIPRAIPLKLKINVMRL